MSFIPERISELLLTMQSGISDNKALAEINVLKLNDNKTELMFVNSINANHLHNIPTLLLTGNVHISFNLFRIWALN